MLRSREKSPLTPLRRGGLNGYSDAIERRFRSSNMSKSDIENATELIQDCIEGRQEARQAFMDRYGVVIYNYPAVLSRGDRHEAGDFFLYAFEKDRIFKRLRHFRGERIGLEDYLRFYVLKDLFFEWRRFERQRKPRLDPYDDAVSPELEDKRDDAGGQGEFQDPDDRTSTLYRLLQREEFFVLKLLYLQGIDLTGDDIRMLAKLSGRTIGEAMSLLAEVEEKLAARTSENREMEEKLTTVYMIMVGYQERIAVLRNELEHLDPRYHASEIKACSEEIAELERKWQWRVTQRKALFKRLWDRNPTTPYNDLGRLLNRPLGSICSAVARARKAFRKACEEAGNGGRGLEAGRESIQAIKKEGPDNELPR